jgi:hypothetical protein
MRLDCVERKCSECAPTPGQHAIQADVFYGRTNVKTIDCNLFVKNILIYGAFADEMLFERPIKQVLIETVCRSKFFLCVHSIQTQRV